jgi:phosphoribosylglycinamide formyltransferase-1
VVNLLAALDDERYGAAALARARATAERAGYALRRIDAPDPALEAWIDAQFPASSWSSEARGGSAWIAERDGAIAGFAAFGARDLRFFWLRRWRERLGFDVGVFGPFGVAPDARGTGIGAALLVAALCGLREAGCASALIPAVGYERLIRSYVERTGAAVVDEFDLRIASVRATILASGVGSNARNVLESARAGRLPIEVGTLIANDAHAGALDAAREHGVAAQAIVWDRAGESRAAFDARVIDAVAQSEPQLVLLLGWMHLLPDAFLERFPQTINLHPAFLPLDPAADTTTAPDGTTIPALRGAHALRDALRDGVPWVGATVHRVTPDTDRGEVLVRTPVAVSDAANEIELRERVRPAELATVPAAIRRWSFERVG